MEGQIVIDRGQDITFSQFGDEINSSEVKDYLSTRAFLRRRFTRECFQRRGKDTSSAL